MSAFFKIAAVADRLGLRPLLARGASLAYQGKSFEVDAQGRWINRQAEATFVSPSLHTRSYSEVVNSVLGYWAWDYMPVAGDTVIDVGAGIGEDSVVFSRIVGPEGRIIAIEAHPATFECLQRTIEGSGLTNVTAVNCAIADRDGEIAISSRPNHVMNSILGDGGGVTVPARTLDSLADELGIGEVALLKMNIEGAEKLAVQGFDRLAPRVRHAAISCHDFVATHFGGADHYYTKEQVRAALEARGFSIRERPDAAVSWVRDYLYASR
jgi:FkbM family methyltransferase